MHYIPIIKLSKSPAKLLNRFGIKYKKILVDTMIVGIRITNSNGIGGFILYIKVYYVSCML